MRVIAGSLGSRPLHAPVGAGTRPTSDRLRETLFNVLASRGGLAGLTFVDLYAGSGAVGIEAISRGAPHCYFVEKARPALAALGKNLSALGIGPAQGIVVPGDVSAFLFRWPRPCDIVFLDPPYEDVAAYTRVLHWLGSAAGATALAPGALVIAEHAAANTRKDLAELAAGYGALTRTRLLRQSDAALSFYALQKD